MVNAMTNHKQATDWADNVIARNRTSKIFGKFGTGVAWTEVGNRLNDYKIPIDPYELAARTNRSGSPLLLNHDPGKPIGKVIAANVFENETGEKFIAVVLGYYNTPSGAFSDFNFDFSTDPGAPNDLPELTDAHWIEIAVDPREVASAWVDNAVAGAPIRIKTRTLSHNAAEATAEVIRVALPYIALVWNPFVTAIATKAGEDTYKALRKWLEELFRKFSEHRNPIVVLQSSLGDVDVTFIVRGNKIDTLIEACASLEKAASQAHHLTAALREKNAPARFLFYEFDPGRKAWLPSYAELLDGRIITDNRSLIITENLPMGLSLGLGDSIDYE